VQSDWTPVHGSYVQTSVTITLTTDENAQCRWSLTDQAYSAMPGGSTPSPLTHTGTIPS
jgi:hypothetical protein